MPFNIRRKKHRQGSALAYALVVLAATSIILVSILGFISSQIRNASYTLSREQAFQAAEQGIQFYKWYLAHQTDGRTAAQISAFWSSGTAYGVASDYVADVADPSGGDMGTYRLKVTPPASGSTIVTVTSTGEMNRFPGSTRTIRVRFRRPSWSENMVLANDDMRFGEGTVVTGKIQSNKGIRFDGYANNVVSSALTSYTDPDHSGGSEFGVHTHVNAPPSTGSTDSFRPLEAPPNAVPARPDVFAAGRQLGVASTDFNGVIAVLADMKANSNVSPNKYFASSGNSSSGRKIVLKPNHTFDTATVTYNTLTQDIISTGSVSNYSIPKNGIIFVEGNITLSGQINGDKITVVAANLTGSGAYASVYIPNDLLYTNFDGSDVIGVIAQQDVNVPYGSDTNLVIDAALVAQKGKVGRYNYGDHKDSITVNGAIATNERYGFAYIDGTGYTDRYLNYDNNLLYYPPPYFPTGTQYQVDLWEEL